MRVINCYIVICIENEGTYVLPEKDRHEKSNTPDVDRHVYERFFHLFIFFVTHLSKTVFSKILNSQCNSSTDFK